MSLRIILVEDNNDVDDEGASLPEKKEIFGKKVFCTNNSVPF